MKCPKCGKLIPVAAKFCGACGTRISGASVARDKNPEPAKEKPVSEKQELEKPVTEPLPQQKSVEKQISAIPDKGNTESHAVVAHDEEYEEPNPEFSAKKRVLFVLIGLFFGFLGLHFLYARRTFLFLLTLLSLVSLIAYAMKGQQLIVLASTLAMLALWFGGTLFTKRDDFGLPMKWFGPQNLSHASPLKSNATVNHKTTNKRSE